MKHIDFRRAVPEISAEYAAAGIMLSRRRLLDELKARMTDKQWGACEAIIDQTAASLPHHLNKGYVKAKADRVIQAWKVTRYEFMYGPLKCKHCGSTSGPLFDKVISNPTYLARMEKVYDFCSDSCSKSSEGAAAKRVATVMKLHGVDNVARTKHFRDAMEQHTQDGVYVKSGAKGQRTRARKHGSVKASYRAQRAKTRKTNQRRYGGNAPTCSEAVRNRVRQAVIKNWGVANVSQHPEIQQRIRAAQKQRKKVRIGGVLFAGLQGFEPDVIKWLIRVKGVDAKYISINATSYEYVNHEGKEATYFPDFELPGKRRFIIEVKASYTAALKQDTTDGYAIYKRNYLKSKAVTDAGDDYRFIIYCDKCKDCFVWHGTLPKNRKVLREAFEHWQCQH